MELPTENRLTGHGRHSIVSPCQSGTRAQVTLEMPYMEQLLAPPREVRPYHVTGFLGVGGRGRAQKVASTGGRRLQPSAAVVTFAPYPWIAAWS
jgi:hypothetical protein